MTKSALLLAGLLTLAACVTTPATPPVSQATVQAHLDAAPRATDGDLQPLPELCKPAPADRPKGDDKALAALIAKPSPPPGRPAGQLIERDLRRVGLNRARIKDIIITHGHGDHYGGATISSSAITRT